MMEGNQVVAEFGFSVATAGDVNGDGFSDIIVGAPGYDYVEGDEGVAFIFHGSPAGLNTAFVILNAPFPQSSAAFGRSVAAAGDVNGDGYSDVIVGAPAYYGGAVFLYYGSPAGLNATPQMLEDEQTNASFGGIVATAGDVNGDGYSDVIVGAYGFDNGQTDEGAAYVYYGSPAGLNAAALRLEKNQAGAYFGRSVATAGDVNGDGYSDILVGAPNYDNGQTNEGAAFLYHGSATGLGLVPIMLESDQAEAYFGGSVGTAGDVNGDGYSDVLVGASTYTNGQVYEGAAFLYNGSVSGLNLTPLILEGNQMYAYLGRSVATAGDVNGDGYSDILVGAPEYDNGQTDEGAAFLYHGSATGLDLVPILLESNQTTPPNFGEAVGTAGDVNGDGFSDVLVGAPNFANGETDEGASFLYYGCALGLSPTPLVLDSNQASAYSGYSVGTAGDVNGDGYGDVIVGAIFYDNGQTDEGAAFLYYGSASGLNTTPLMLESDQAGANFGEAVGTAGDLNGDGYSDVIVGAYGYDNGQANEGVAFLYYGSASGLNSTPLILESNQAEAYFGYSVATAGDINGDGYSDIIVGAMQYDNGQTDEGAAFVYYGSASGLNTTPVLLEANQANANFGYSVATAGDVNGDGFSDVIVGANYYDNVESNEGAAFLYYGTAAGLNPAPLQMEVNQVNAYFGWSVGTAGDVNRDGYSDVIVGAYGYDNGQTNEGAAFLYYGSIAGLNTTPLILESNQASAYFGNSVASAEDVNRDGYSDVLVGAYLYDNGQTDEGAVFLYYGSGAGLNTTSSRLEADQASAQFGWSVASAGDVNGDGFSDVILGARNYDNGQTDEGAAFLYYGGGGRGVSLRPQQIRTDLSAPIAPLGLANEQTFRIGLKLRTPFGRDFVRLEWQTAPLGASFDPVSSPVQREATWWNSGTAGYYRRASIALPEEPGPYMWRARVAYFPARSPFQSHSPWFTMAANALLETDLRSVTAVACVAPDEPCWVYLVTTDGTNHTLNFQDPNQENQRTGWNVRRSDDPSVVPKSSWPVVCSDCVDMDAGAVNYQWTDTSGDIPPSGTWYYLVTAYNDNCPAEGPFSSE